MAKKKTPHFLEGLKKGALHQQMGVKQGEKIPVADLHSKLAAAKKSGDVQTERRVVFALNAKHFHHGKGNGNA